MNNKFYTLLHAAKKSAAHYQVAKQGLNELTSSEILSNAFRDLLHDKFDTYAVQPDFGNCTLKANKAARDEWRAENEGKQHIKQEDFDMLTAMQQALFAQTNMLDMKVIELPEVAYKGVTIPAATLLEHNGKYYYHTAVTDISLAAYADSCKKYGLLYRIGLQHMALQQHLGKDVNIGDVYVVAVEKNAPHSVAEFNYALDLLVEHTVDILDLVAEYEVNNDATPHVVAQYDLAYILEL
jgi:hypothetical protein